MNGQEYLDQISATTKPSTSSGSGILHIVSSKLFRIIAGGIILFILLIIVGNIISSATGKGRVLAEQLELRLTNLSEMLNQNSNEYLKDTNLRSLNLHLITTLNDTNNQLTNYLVNAYGFTTKNIPAKVQTEESNHIEELTDELEEARLNGLYDRTYVNSIDTEISLIIALEENILDRTNSPELTDILNQSISSLNSILTNFENFNNS